MFEEENEADLKDQLDFNLSLDAPTFTGMRIFTNTYFYKRIGVLLHLNFLFTL